MRRFGENGGGEVEFGRTGVTVSVGRSIAAEDL